MPFTDVSAGAAWRTTLLPFPGGAATRISIHPVWDLEGVSRWHCAGDLMHTGCLGVVSWLLGGVLYELVYDGPFNGAVEDRRAPLWMLILSKYEDQGVPVSRRMGDLDLGRFRHSNDFAELHI